MGKFRNKLHLSTKLKISPKISILTYLLTSLNKTNTTCLIPAKISIKGEMAEIKNLKARLLELMLRLQMWFCNRFKIFKPAWKWLNRKFSNLREARKWPKRKFINIPNKMLTAWRIPPKKEAFLRLRSSKIRSEELWKWKKVPKGTRTLKLRGPGSQVLLRAP